MHSIKIEIPAPALRPLVKAATVTYSQFFDWVFGIDREINLQLPESFEEFTPYHLETFSKAINSKNVNENWYNCLIRDLCRMNKAAVNALDGEQVQAISPLLEYLKESYTNPKSLFPKIGIFRGPANLLKNFTIERLSYTDSYAMAYQSSPSKEHLNLFFASAYRPFFLPWSKHLLSWKWLYKLVSHQKKQTALTNYFGLRSNLVTTHPTTFEGGEENTGIEQFGWTGTILNLAGDKFGTYKNAKKVRVPDAFALFEINGIQIKRANDKIKK